MRVLFVVKSKIMENLGVMYLAAVIKKAKHDCKILDIWEAFKTATSYKPDIIGYSIMTGDENRFLELNKKLKQQMEFVSIVGGPHPTFFPDNFENNPDIDYVVKGEAEQWFSDFLHDYSNYGEIDLLPWPDRADFPDMPIRDFIASRGCNHACSYC